jgi:hypothetical protein
MLHRTRQELEYCLNVLRATKEAHVEVCWDQKTTCRVFLRSAENRM